MRKSLKPLDIHHEYEVRPSLDHVGDRFYVVCTETDEEIPVAVYSRGQAQDLADALNNAFVRGIDWGAKLGPVLDEANSNA